MTSAGRAELLLVELTAAIGPADWERFGRLVSEARSGGVPRRALEEMLLQATLFFGFPRVVSAFEALVAEWPDQPDAGTGVPADARRSEGEALFEAIYRDNTNAVREMLASFHPEFHDFVIESAYGRVLARPGLEPRVRELCAIAALAVLDQIPQLVAHGRGALALGASTADVESTLKAALPAEDVSPLMRRIAKRRG